REILSRVYNILIRIFFGVGFSDAQCGFKGVTRKLADHLIPHLEDNAWFFDSELLIVGEKMGYRLKQIPVIWTDNPGSTVRVLKTVHGDLAGLWRLFRQKPWLKLPKYE
ncbi:MAG: Glycosyl transferase, partial [Candidatus Gottesmanbacteria bacterium GW2011_GWA2_42_18]